MSVNERERVRVYVIMMINISLFFLKKKCFSFYLLLCLFVCFSRSCSYFRLTTFKFHFHFLFLTLSPSQSVLFLFFSFLRRYLAHSLHKHICCLYVCLLRPGLTPFLSLLRGRQFGIPHCYDSTGTSQLGGVASRPTHKATQILLRDSASGDPTREPSLPTPEHGSPRIFPEIFPESAADADAPLASDTRDDDSDDSPRNNCARSGVARATGGPARRESEHEKGSGSGSLEEEGSGSGSGSRREVEALSSRSSCGVWLNQGCVVDG